MNRTDITAQLRQCVSITQMPPSDIIAQPLIQLLHFPVAAREPQGFVRSATIAADREGEEDNPNSDEALRNLIGGETHTAKPENLSGFHLLDRHT